MIWKGYDKFVLDGLNLDKIKPRVILTEFEDNKTIKLGYSFLEYADYLVDKGYHIIIPEWFPIVQYRTRHKWKKLNTYPWQLDDDGARG